MNQSIEAYSLDWNIDKKHKGGEEEFQSTAQGVTQLEHKHDAHITPWEILRINIKYHAMDVLYALLTL